MHRTLRNWKKGKITREKYIEEKSKLKVFLERKQEKWKEEEESELKDLKNESEVWRYINKRRRGNERIRNNIGKEDWKKHFMKLLNGAEIKEREEPERKDETIKEGGKEDRRDDMEFIEEDVGRAIERLKNKKVPGIDGISIEAWRYGGAAIRKGLTELLRRIWNRDNLSEDWKTSVILPLYKKGDQEKTENYRGISLLCSAYKIYAEMIRRKLQEETERLEVLPENQGGFRKGTGTMDNIFVLNI